MMCPNFIYWILQVLKDSKVSKSLINVTYALKASSTATATATVIPTMGLLPVLIKPKSNHFLVLIITRAKHIFCFFTEGLTRRNIMPDLRAI